ncbi:MAG: Farnesyl diphosphate synthase [Syntrophus sp. PtaU1.Bin208]|nr:MAG: Farnesyl diphosphate synthase [Syntrophus sp. PtaU1.Bin208]
MNPEPVFDLNSYLKARKEQIDEALDLYLPGEEKSPAELFKAMRYSIFAGGKRIRPILCLAAAETVGKSGFSDAILPVACALEYIHTYSLIHDDLPAMDNDDYRRGNPTSHKVFGEALAILTGDALLTEAFSLMSRSDLQGGSPAENRLRVLSEIAAAAGAFGMVGGQVDDVQAEGKPGNLELLNQIHARKTGAMIVVSLRAGAILAGGTESDLSALTDYGHKIGLVFQIADDILNVEGDSKLLGKNTGSDATRGKMTFPNLLGLEISRQKALSLVEEAISDLDVFDRRATPLRQLARYFVERRF